MKLNIFRKRPTSIMVMLSQDEAWELIHSLVAQMQRNYPNAERKEFFTVASEYFSVCVEPDPIRNLTSKDRNNLTRGMETLLQMLQMKVPDPEYQDFVKEWTNNISPKLRATLEKLAKVE